MGGSSCRAYLDSIKRKQRLAKAQEQSRSVFYKIDPKVKGKNGMVWIPKGSEQLTLSPKDDFPTLEDPRLTLLPTPAEDDFGIVPAPPSYTGTPPPSQIPVLIPGQYSYQTFEPWG